MRSNPEMNEQTLPSTCKSLACYEAGSSPISDELSYLGSQSTERLHPGGSVCGHCDNSEIILVTAHCEPAKNSGKCVCD